MQYRSKKIAKLAIFTSITLILGYLENFFPVVIPGVKLGLSNIGILLAIYSLGFSYAISIAFLKSMLLSLFSGNFIVKLVVGLPSTMVSAVVMYIYYILTFRFSTPISNSALGAYVHLLSQFIIIKLLFIKNLEIFMILPYFSTLSILTGVLTGIVTLKILNTIEVLDVSEDYIS